MGPDLTWYLAVSAFLFAIGALGVMLRRSPLIVLLSLEIMLNGANLALITFSRHHARAGRTDLRARGDGRRRLRGRGRARPDRRRPPAEARARRRQALDAARMITAAWVCLLAPLAAAVAITLGGTRLSRRAAGYLATLSVAVSFVAAARRVLRRSSAVPRTSDRSRSRPPGRGSRRATSTSA